MKYRNKQGVSGRTIVMAAVALLGFGVQWVEAQELKIDTRPLTTGEIAKYGMTNTTQIANGTHVVGLGQPVYLDLLVDKGTVVTQAVWTIDGVYDLDNLPILDSNATITNSPLPMSMPTYDSVDRNTYDVVDREMIVPDKRGYYQISVQAFTTNGVLNTNIEVVGSVFIGKDDGCYVCHQDKKPLFETTLHSHAFKDQINGEGSSHFSQNCIKCHVTGYDTAPLAVNSGWDDVQNDTGWVFPTALSTNNWDEMPPELQNKSNIQCEMCHGPGQLHYRMLDPTKIGVSLSAGTCGQCHDAPSHHVKNFEWGNSIHGQTTVDRTGECVDCHTTAGFINARDPGVLFGEVLSSTNYATFKEGITCAACHDPHAKGEQIHQLRDVKWQLMDGVTTMTNAVQLENGDIITDGGAGIVCMSCHHSRRDAETYVYGSFSSHSGPHHGPQGDMLAGKNAIEYGQNMPSSKHLTQVEDSCAHCHMQEIPADLPAYAEGKVGGHSFALAYDDGVNPEIHLTGACTECHGDIGEDFNFGGEDYDLDGIVEGVQEEIVGEGGLLEQLAMLLPPLGSNSVSAADCVTLSQKRGAYNYLFVEEDGSEGVHNPKYAAAILRASIDDLNGIIDIDRDGLDDRWEKLYFGDITSQSGSDDFDGDGLTNAQEQNLGTDPTLEDTDGDGYSDLVEVQGGSIPAGVGSTNSVPTSDMVIVPAAEVGYLPQGTNTTVQFQAIDSLTGGSWTNVGTAKTNENSGWIYQLDSTRENGERFYRAIEE